MSQYADDRDVDTEMRNDLIEQFADPMCGPHKPDVTIPDPEELNAEEMVTLRAALLFTATLASSEQKRYSDLYERLVSVPSLVIPPF